MIEHFVIMGIDVEEKGNSYELFRSHVLRYRE